ncbi:sulfatase-like hydrolase/transferase [Chitinispirillales bacterium ANBcel5]|uniref:sulfatase-like hydrolase/transferase n=1 Tax=Cellulosispirillum alkaliphilum TaxID=3039283 RepID=UPI002A505D15|nr:sulfatase-like hydrolase/transferase [Chitinispirillales bacterium ANBcel5]
MNLIKIARLIGKSMVKAKLKRRYIEVIAVSLCFVATLFAFTPYSIYFNNAQEFTIPSAAVYSMLLFPAIALWVVLQFFLFLIPERLYNYALSLLSASTVLFWLQGNVLQWDYGVLDGRQIAWSEMRLQGMLDLILWAGIITFAIVKRRWVKRAATALAGVLLATQLVSFAMISSGPVEPVSAHSFSIDNSQQFAFSEDKNVILLILDAFQADIMQEIIATEEHYSAMLDGFTFYRNAASAYSKTYPTMPLFLTGQWYENHMPIQRFLNRTFSRYSINSEMLNEGWQVDLFPWVPRTIYFSRAMASNMRPKIGLHEQMVQIGKILDLTFFRATPHFMKSYWLNDYQWRLSGMFKQFGFFVSDKQIDEEFSHEPHPHMAIEFTEMLTQTSRVPFNTPVFKMYHLNVPHEPFFLTEDLRMERLPSGREGFLRHSVAAMEIVKRLLDTLKELEIYDESMILIVSDHGGGEYNAGVVFDYLPAEIGTPDTLGKFIDPAHHQSALPLVLIKPFSSRGDLKISDAPVSLGDIAKTIAEESGIESGGLGGENILHLKEGQDRERRYLYYEFSSWKRDYLPSMKEYTVRGHSWLPQNWEATGAVFEPRLEYTRPADTLLPYKTGQVMSFTDPSYMRSSLVRGWSNPESHGTWSNGSSAEITIRMEERSRAPESIAMYGFGFLASGQLNSQRVILTLNGEEIGQWDVSQPRWYRAEIPSHLIYGTELLEFRLEFPDAASPADFGLNLDTRKLGFALIHMLID